MTVPRPDRAQIAELARQLELGIAHAELADFALLVDEALAVHDWLDEVEDELTPPGPSGRDPGRRPEPAENPLGAWYWKTHITEAADGPLSGRTVAVKDNVCVAGVPMMNGSVVLEGYVPDHDATVVARVLAAGATIAGKAVCEPLSYSGSSHLSDSGPVRNPYDPRRSSGGSSSGCGALLGAGEVDLAIGGDQGGSIRCPSSWSGVYGLKPTYGLVPYTGAFPLEMTIDHLGPMARTSADVALLLDALAGPDGLDPRQSATAAGSLVATASYAESLTGDVGGLRIGVLVEGFDWDGLSETDVDEAARDAAVAFGRLGARVGDVSVPWHRVGGRVTGAIAAEGMAALLIHGEGLGSNWRGLYVESMLHALAEGRRRHARRLPPTMKTHALAGQWMHDRARGIYYARAQNAARRLAAEYDKALASVDLLLMPTTPLKPALLPEPGLSPAESAHVAHRMGQNTSPFDASGHPAMSLPCALSEGLPVGLMLVGRRGEDATVLRAAHAFETQVYRPPAPVSG